MQNKLWNEYVHGKQTAEELGNKYGRCRQWVAKQLNEINADDNKIIGIMPQSIVVVADATFFSRSDGVLIFREPNLKKNLIWKEIHFQMCQFHQVAIINRYLTRRPILEAGKELRKIALLLTELTENEFTELLNN